MIPPSASVDVEKFKNSVAWVASKFDLGESIKVDCSQKTESHFFELRKFDSFHERRGTTEIRRMRTNILGMHRSHCFPFDDQDTATELLFAASAGDQVLNHHFTGWHEGGGFGEPLHELCFIVNSPSLRLGSVNKVLFDSRLQNQGEFGINGFDFVEAV